MDALELLETIQRGESSTVQFKVRINDTYKVGTEMVAFSNAKGGIIIIGVDDTSGQINGLTFEEIQTCNQLLSNAATDNIKPPIYIETETVTVSGQQVIIARIPEGASKPFMDNKGIIWTKNGSDKRKVIAKEEIAHLLQSSGNLFADEVVVKGSTINDLDESLFIEYFTKNWGETPKEFGLSMMKALENTYVFKDANLTLGGLLFLVKTHSVLNLHFALKP